MRLIDADACPKLFDEEFKETRRLVFEGEYHLDNLAEGFSEAAKVIRKMPAIEAEPVKHGRWIQVICHEEYEDGFVDRVKECCSVCHAPNWRRTTNYCPNCGAKMGLEEENDE